MNLLLIVGLFLHCHPSFVIGSVKDVTDEFFRGESGDVLAAFGDFNADKQVDIFVLSEEGKQVDLLLSGDKSNSFSRKTLIYRNDSSDHLITSVMPGDFNGDVQMDLLITRQPPDQLDAPVTVEVYWGSGNTVDPKPYILPKQLQDQPLLFDWNADMLPDLLSETKDGEHTERTVWQANCETSYCGSKEPVEKGFEPISINGNGTEEKRFARPSSHAFLDLDADHIADLVIATEEGFEIWLNTYGMLHKNLTIPRPDEIKINGDVLKVVVTGQPAFADLDMDSKIEMLLPVCTDKDCKNSFILAYPDILYGSKWLMMMHEFQFETFKWGFVPPDDVVSQEDIKQQFPITLRMGDINSDGYPDALAVLRNVEGPDKFTKQVAFVLENEECGSEMCKDFGRTFSLPSEAALREQESVAQAAIFDLYEDGILDIVTTIATDESNVTKLMAFKNDLRADACFLKITVISGLCGSSCPGGRHPYGVNQPGPAVRYKTTTTDGKRQESCTSQLTQSAHYALQMPFMIFGLGPTPNYIEYINVGIQTPEKEDKRRREWTALIPNSQLIVIPHPPGSPSNWMIQLFVTPSHLLFVTGAILLGTCGFFAIIVAILQFRKKKKVPTATLR